MNFMKIYQLPKLTQKQTNLIIEVNWKGSMIDTFPSIQKYTPGIFSVIDNVD